MTGNEWDYVLLSCVKSKYSVRETDENAAKRYEGNLDFLAYDFNVAISRAKKGLIVIGKYHFILLAHYLPNLFVCTNYRYFIL